MPNLSHSQFAIRKGQVFATKADVSTAIDRWSLDPLYKFALRNRRSTTKYIDRQCFYASRGCPWRVRARICQDTRNNPNFGMFVVTKVDANHTCEEYGRAGKCETVNRKRWLDGWVRENLDVDDAKVKPDTVVRKLREVVGEDICYDRAQAALARVRKVREKEREKERENVQGSEAATMAGDFLGPATPGGLLDLAGLTSPAVGMGLQSGSQVGSGIGQIPPQGSIERYTLSSLSSSVYGSLNTPSQTTPLQRNLSSSLPHHQQQQQQQQTPTRPAVPPVPGPPTPYLAYRPPAGVDPLDIVRQYIQWTISRIPSAREQLEKAANAITGEYHDVEGIMVFTDDDWKRLEVPLGLGRRLARDVVRFAQEKGWRV